VRPRVSFFQGSASSFDDLKRVNAGDALMTYVLPSLDCFDFNAMKEQDVGNAMKALSVLIHCEKNREERGGEKSFRSSSSSSSGKPRASLGSERLRWGSGRWGLGGRGSDNARARGPGNSAPQTSDEKSSSTVDDGRYTADVQLMVQRLLLVCLLPTSKVSVQNLGIDRHKVVTLAELKSDFLGLSCRVPGGIPFVANLFFGVEDRRVRAMVAALEGGHPHFETMRAYLLGAVYEIYGGVVYSAEYVLSKNIHGGDFLKDFFFVGCVATRECSI